MSKLSFSFTNPYGYATYTDAVAAIPNLSTITNAANIYNFFTLYMPAYIDPSRYQAMTAMLSFNLNMFFFTQYVDAITNDEFYSDDYLSTSGTISSVMANGVNTAFAANIVAGNWESSFNQNDYGVTYLSMAKALNLALGVDGQGTPWAAV
jgi:hypothetical protein